MAVVSSFLSHTRGAELAAGSYTYTACEKRGEGRVKRLLLGGSKLAALLGGTHGFLGAVIGRGRLRRLRWRPASALHSKSFGGAGSKFLR